MLYQWEWLHAISFAVLLVNKQYQTTFGLETYFFLREQLTFVIQITEEKKVLQDVLSANAVLSNYGCPNMLLQTITALVHRHNVF